MVLILEVVNNKLMPLKPNSVRRLGYRDDYAGSAKFIWDNCDQYLPIIKEAGYLYRGFMGAPVEGDLFYGYPRADRLPKDSLSSYQLQFDRILQAMGVKALRSNSLFCNGSVAVAADYGMVYAIIPCNDAVYAWSRKIHDIILDDLNLDIAGSFLAEPFKTVTPELIKKFQHYFEIDTTDLGEAIKQRHEVWLHGHYVAIPRGEALAMKAELFGSGVNG